MSRHKQSSLNRLQTVLPEGGLATTAWLGKHGYSRQLVAKYAGAGWLEAIARGVFRRPGPPLKWQHVAGSLQNLLDLPVHVGGLTALELQGKSHFLRLSGIQTVHLYSIEPLPSWLSKLPLKDKFVVHRERLFVETEGTETAVSAHLARDPASSRTPPGVGLTQLNWGAYDWPLIYSTVERAYLELLDDIVAPDSIAHANLILQGLTTLSPRRLKTLLAACRSIKVKRLFFALAERNNHQWLSELDPKEFDLGKGKRQLAPGGKLHPKYLITLPAELDDAH
jgi:hypothetical protein